MNDLYLPVDTPKIGEKYHTKWASKIGMVWRCIEIQEETVTLQTPKTKKIIKGVKKSDLLHLKRVGLLKARNDETRSR